MLISRNKFIVLTVDVFLLIVSYFGAFWLRFESITPAQWILIKTTVIPIVVVKMVIFSYLGLHAGPWRYTGVLDLINLARATALSFLVILVGMVYFYHPQGFSRSIFILDAINTLFLIGMFRLSIRIAYSRQLLHGIMGKVFGSIWANGGSGSEKRVLIYGANERGEMLLRSLISTQESNASRAVGFVDDDPNCKGVIIHGIRHVGTTDDLQYLIDKFNVSEIMVASDPSKETMRRISSICRDSKVPCRLIPPYFDIVHKGFGVSQLRDLAIDDLLRRDTVKIDHSQVKELIQGKKVLITGAAGSIGKELCLQILEFQPSELVCIDLGENPLFFLQQEILSQKTETKCTFYCSNVTNRRKMATLFSRHRPQLVFHAAAHKHVPLMESNVDEVISNNVGGTKVVADMANEYGTEIFLFISTDKAVKPANVMGWTKRMGEVYTQYLSDTSKTKFLSVRFGNVLGSNGSVVPIFKNQIEKGGPVLVTHPDTTRYFMTIPEAVLLILQSTLLGEQGDIMILDMGEPVKIAELAEEMIHLAGYSPGKEIKIEYIGLRQGEKLHEELLSDIEELKPTFHEKVSIVKSNSFSKDTVPVIIDRVLGESFEDPNAAYNSLRSSLNELASNGVKLK